MKKRFLIWDNPKDAIISLTLLLMLVGCINVFSASFVEARDMLSLIHISCGGTSTCPGAGRTGLASAV